MRSNDINNKENFNKEIGNGLLAEEVKIILNI